MREQTRYRLTGAVFLLAIGIIVLPMVFDGEGVRVKQLPELTEPLPPMPNQSELDALEISQAEIEQHRIEQQAVGGVLDDEGFHSEDGTRLGDPILRELDSSAAAEGEQAVVQTGEVQRDTDASSTLDSAIRPAEVEAPPRTAPVRSKTTTPNANPRANKTPLTKQAIWAVQLASFASPVNATALRDRLLGDGFEAWTSTARRDAGIRTRVAIGPLLDRGDADRMRDLVSGRYNVSAIVVHMEP